MGTSKVASPPGVAQDQRLDLVLCPGASDSVARSDQEGS